MNAAKLDTLLKMYPTPVLLKAFNQLAAKRGMSVADFAREIFDKNLAAHFRVNPCPAEPSKGLPCRIN
jgi:hypothetical protein